MKTSSRSSAPKQTLLIVDLYSKGVSLQAHPLSSLSALEAISSHPLQLPLDVATDDYFIPGSPLEILQGYLEELQSLENTIVIVGAKSDPFHPFEGKFDIALKAMELFSVYQPKHLSLQTRSPLVVITLPVLKSLGERVSVTMALESLDDTLALKNSPALPRVDERIKAARTLKCFGVPVIVQGAPILSSIETRVVAENFARVLDDIGHLINLISLEALVANDCPSSQSYNETAYQAVHDELEKIAPDKLIGLICAEEQVAA